MESLNFFKPDGALKLPPGFRFQPTDQEIVFQYLARKIYSNPLPASVVPEITPLCNYDPWDFPVHEDQDSYFFTKKEAKYQNGNRTNRSTRSGYWKATGSDKRITCSQRNDIIGMRKTLVFHSGKPPSGTRTDWIIHEYRLTATNNTEKCYDSIDQWVMCHLFLKKTSGGNGDEEMVQNYNYSNPRVNVYDFMNKRDSAPSISSSSSSNSSCGSTVVTDHEEHTSGY